MFCYIPTGRYEVEITAPDHQGFTEGILLRTDETVDRRHILEPTTTEPVAERFVTSSRVEERYETPKIVFSRSKQNFWRTNKWIGLAGTVLTIGAGFYYDMEGQSYSDDYYAATNSHDRRDAWDNLEDTLDKRDLTFYVSVAPAIYTVVSRLRERPYNRRLK